MISATTIVGPTGVPQIIDVSIPDKAQSTDMIIEHIVTDLKFLNTRIADIAGNIMSADMSSEPTRFIASTITTAIKDTA